MLPDQTSRAKGTNRRAATLLTVGAAAAALATLAVTRPAPASSAAGAGDTASIQRQYGPAMRVGNGQARTYVLYDRRSGGAPLEVGIALDERAFDGLPAPNPQAAAHANAGGHEHLDNHVYLLDLPARGVAPFKFVELDWNPGGHEPPGVYDEPHFDFHFYTVPASVRSTIVPSDSQFQQKADNLPPERERAPFYAMAAPPGAPAPAVPLMGVHWIDTRSPELQKMFGNPAAWRPFTTTFLFGSWDGRVTFLEPMITRAHILAKKTAADPAVRDEVIPVPTAPAVGAAGYYPSAYRIAWDAEAEEYHIALTRLALRD
jgi:hypothetical protein